MSRQQYDFQITARVGAAASTQQALARRAAWQAIWRLYTQYEQGQGEVNAPQPVPDPVMEVACKEGQVMLAGRYSWPGGEKRKRRKSQENASRAA